MLRRGFASFLCVCWSSFFLRDGIMGPKFCVCADGSSRRLLFFFRDCEVIIDSSFQYVVLLGQMEILVGLLKLMGLSLKLKTIL